MSFSQNIPYTYSLFSPYYRDYKISINEKKKKSNKDLKICQKVKEVGDLMTGESTIEAPINGGHNYNGPKAMGGLQF